MNSIKDKLKVAALLILVGIVAVSACNVACVEILGLDIGEKAVALEIEDADNLPQWDHAPSSPPVEVKGANVIAARVPKPEIAPVSPHAKTGVLSPGDWWRERLAKAPNPPDGMTLEEAERLHRVLDVSRFNSGGDLGLRNGTDYGGVAEQLDVHVDELKRADHYVHYERIKYLGEAVREALAADIELEPDYYHPISETASLGTYTVHASIVVAGCKGEKLEDRAEEAAGRLAHLIGPIADGFQVGQVRYRCERLGTEGTLDLGYIWDTERFIRMPACSGTRGKRLAKDTQYWCDRAWNNRKVVEH